MTESAPVEQEEDDADLGVVGVLEDGEVHAAHQPVEARREAGADAAELLRTHPNLTISPIYPMLTATPFPPRITKGRRDRV